MAGHVDHIVGAAQDEEVAILVTHSPVKRVVDQLARNTLPVGVHKPCIVAPHGLHTTRWQRAFDDDHPFLVGARQGLPGALVDQFHVVAVGGQTRAAKLAGLLLHPVGNTQDRPAAFGLPVVVDDGHVECTADPLRGGFVQRLPGQEQGLQARQVVLGNQRRVLFAQHPDGGGGREHVTDLVFLHQAPPHACVGPGGQAFVQDG